MLINHRHRHGATVLRLTCAAAFLVSAMPVAAQAPTPVRPEGNSGFAADRPIPRVKETTVVRATASADTPKPQPIAKALELAIPLKTDALPAAASLDELVRTALEGNPRIARASFLVDAARGRTIQAGLYPNPVLSFTGDEFGDRTAPAGILTVPQFSQEIVTGGKLSLSQAVAAHEIDQATLNVLAERYRVVGTVRAAYFEVVALQRRAAILVDLVKLAEQSAARGKELSDGGNLPRLDLIQLELERERFRAELAAVRRELPGANRRLVAIVGKPAMTERPLVDGLDIPLPDYDLEKAREVVAATHPEIRAAKVGIERAQAAHRRAQAEPIPNVTLQAGYTRQNQNKSNDFMIGVSLPLPVWNRNQGNISAALADIGAAGQDVGRVEMDLVEKLATAHRTYAAARERADRYRTDLIPRAEETYKLSSEAFKGGQFEYLRVIQAQRALSESRLEHVRSLGEAWRAAGELSGFLLEEVWPPAPVPKP